VTEWSVVFEAEAGDDAAGHEVDADRLWPLLEALEGHSPAAGGGGRRYDAQFNVEAVDAAAAWTKALRVWKRAVATAGLPAWPVVHVEVLTIAEQDRIQALPHPELVGVSEIAGLLGTTRNRAWQVTRKPDFPQPLAELAGGPVWALSMVSRFLDEWRRRPGPIPGTRRVPSPVPGARGTKVTST
jgi:hypothetical protein